MIAYEDLVAALSIWRANQGLPANSVSFTAPASGSVDLDLPVADPVAVQTAYSDSGVYETVPDDMEEELHASEAPDEIPTSEVEISAIEQELHTTEDPPTELGSFEDEGMQTMVGDAGAFEDPTAYGAESPRDPSLTYDEETQFETVPAPAGPVDTLEMQVSGIANRHSETVEELPDSAEEDDGFEDAGFEIEAEAEAEDDGEVTQFGTEPMTEELDALSSMDSDETSLGVGVDEFQPPGKRED